MAWLEVATATFSTTFHALQWAFYTIVAVTSYVLQLAAWPIAILWNILLFALAPVIHIVRFFLSPLIFILNNIPRLQPLYIYFASATLIGLAAGLILTLTTTATFSLLGLYDKPSSPECSPPAAASHAQVQVKPRDDSWPGTPGTLGEDDADLDSLLAGLSSLSESDYIHAMAGVRDVPNTKRKRRSAGALGVGTGASRFSTILEEDDDSF